VASLCHLWLLKKGPVLISFFFVSLYLGLIFFFSLFAIPGLAMIQFFAGIRFAWKLRAGGNWEMGLGTGHPPWLSVACYNQEQRINRFKN
jgi:hypothetical protein